MCVSLKPTTSDDYDEYYRIRSSPGDIYWNGYNSKPDKESFYDLFLCRLGAAVFEKNEDRRNYLIQINEDVNVGFVQLIKREDGIDIGYTVVEQYQRHGYASKALAQGIELAKEFDNRIYVQIRDDNIASQKVALKCGMVKTDEYIVKEYPQVGKMKLRKYRLKNN